jgi:uncharacterized protein
MAYKDLWRYINLFKLMFWSEPLPQGEYRIDLDGPISPFVSATTRYGRQMAAFFRLCFAQEFEQKIRGKRGHWRLLRESEVLLLGDTVMIPDFVLIVTEEAFEGSDSEVFFFHN